jgi:hypothetical protein
MPAALPPRLAALVDEALAPYRRLWPAHVLEAFREELLTTLQTHPDARCLAAEALVGLDDPSGEMHVGGGGPVDESPGAPARRSGTQ